MLRSTCCSLAVAAMLSLLPNTCSSLELQWSSGGTEINFSSAVQCTLIVRADSAEGHVPASMQLRWIASGCDLRPIATATCDSATADVTSILYGQGIVDQFGHVVTTQFCAREEDAPSSLRYIFNLPGASKGKLQAVALDPADSESLRTIQSAVVSFNGGLPDSLPPIVLHTKSAHTSTEYTLTVIGAGLSGEQSVLLSGIDDSWQLSLDIISQTGSTLVARGSIAASVPPCQVAMIDNHSVLSGALIPGDPPPPALEPLGSSCQETFHETLLPLPTLQPKDFAFVLGGWTPAGTWVYHLFYTRQNQWTLAHPLLHGGPDSTGLNLGHAVSNDLIDWPMAMVDTVSFRVRPGMFDNGHVWAPCIVKRGLTHYMFYTGVDDLGNQAIGLATSNDLVTWTRQSNPVFAADDLGAWALPRGVSGTDPAQLRDPFVMPDPENPGSWLMYFVTIPANHPDGQIVGFARSNGDFANWQSDEPLYATLHPIGSAYGDVESPTVFEYQGKWWLFYGVREIRPVWAIANPQSPTDVNPANWSQTVDTNDLIIDEFTGEPSGAYYYWHAAEFLNVNAGSSIAFLAGFNDQSVGISYIAVQPTGAPYLFEEHCPVTTTDVGEESATPPEPRLMVSSSTVARGQVRLRVELPGGLHARLTVYDVLGRRIKVIADGHLPAGASDFLWDGSSAFGVRAPSGMYFAALEGAGPRRIARVLFLR